MVSYADAMKHDYARREPDTLSDVYRFRQRGSRANGMIVAVKYHRFITDHASYIDVYAVGACDPHALVEKDLIANLQRGSSANRDLHGIELA
jgi:hypothetical protein